MRIALVNCAVLPEPDPDEAPLLAALRAAGHEAATLAWDNPAADPGAFDVCFLRATWNYYHTLDAFLAWCDRAGERTRLLNPPEVVRWNAHKGYLAGLERAGVAIVPTAFVGRGEHEDIRELARGRGWSGVVVKPAVSAGSFGTRRFGAHELGEAQAFLDTMAGGRDMMVQPYLESVERGGERSLVWIAGELTHAIEKSARFAGEDESVRAREVITAEERAVADRVVAACAHDVFYARIDLMDGAGGEALLSELELIEPSLFFEYSGRALARFVEAAGRLG